MARKQQDNKIYEIDTGIAEIIEESDGSLTLMVNGVPSSSIVVGEPERLDFEYMRWIAAAIEELTSYEKPRLTHLGGAGCSLARYFAHVWPNSRNTVVEIDMDLAVLVREVFDIPKAPAVKIRVGEAREETDKFVPASRDIIIRDVFSSAVTPRPLTTVEFFEAAHSSLSATGLYVANCGDYSDLKNAREELSGMLQVFPHVAAIADPPMLKGRRYGNIILLGSNQPLENSAALTKKLLQGAVPAQFKNEDWARSLASGTVARQDET
ncbi:fused MFS/spermidine synthase [Corynebacterium breve]|uniref:Fused MFS/spermidine synthase n=1 Tax=Corynebacterium breve TaxID=3049799 RepID=A0ABY8VG70_9CORY|nr:fused MFS/spermidine synthase [Corynebacterium breve]WIM68656.1 fused MFS/spermidine synthase [Corynebacterium breve]